MLAGSLAFPNLLLWICERARMVLSGQNVVQENGGLSVLQRCSLYRLRGVFHGVSSGISTLYWTSFDKFGSGPS